MEADSAASLATGVALAMPSLGALGSPAGSQAAPSQHAGGPAPGGLTGAPAVHLTAPSAATAALVAAAVGAAMAGEDSGAPFAGSLEAVPAGGRRGSTGSVSSGGGGSGGVDGARLVGLSTLLQQVDAPERSTRRSAAAKAAENDDGDGGSPIGDAALAVDVATGKFKTCRCRNSRCIKLYCECFGWGEMCGPDCACQVRVWAVGEGEGEGGGGGGAAARVGHAPRKQPRLSLTQTHTAQLPAHPAFPPLRHMQSCLNTAATSAARDAAMEFILQRNPNAFRVGLGVEAPAARGCNCRKSGCQKKYCDCYAAGIQCTSLCRCVGGKDGLGEEGGGDCDHAPPDSPNLTPTARPVPSSPFSCPIPTAASTAATRGRMPPPCPRRWRWRRAAWRASARTPRTWGSC